MSINKIIPLTEEEKEKLNYDEDHLQNIFDKIAESLKNEVSKLPVEKKTQKTKKSVIWNSLVWKMLISEKKKQLSNMENNVYFKSFSKFLWKEAYEVEITDPENLRQDILNYIYYLVSTFGKEIHFLYDWKLEIDEKTSFWREFLALVSMSNYFIRENNKNENEFLEMLENMKISKYIELRDLWFFLEFIYLDYKKSYDDDTKFFEINSSDIE